MMREADRLPWVPLGVCKICCENMHSLSSSGPGKGEASGTPHLEGSWKPLLETVAGHSGEPTMPRNCQSSECESTIAYVSNF